MDYRRHFATRFFGHLISMPFIWAPFPFILMADLMAEIYHHIGFRIYGIPLVKRSEYVQIFDRSKLAYLTWPEKIGCMYCGYVNGVLLYMKEIAGRTERYWCGIIHKDKPGFRIQTHQIEQNFARFNDKADLIDKFGKIR